MRKACIFAISGAMAFSGPFSAFSAETHTQNPLGSGEAPIPLDAGQRAPFEGMLVPFGLASALTAKAEGCEARIDLTRQQAQELADLELKLMEQLRQNDLEVHALQMKVMEQALGDAKPAWWEHPAIWFGVGIVAAIAVVAGSVSILDATRPLSANF